MSDQVRNPENRFSHGLFHMIMMAKSSRGIWVKTMVVIVTDSINVAERNVENIVIPVAISVAALLLIIIAIAVACFVCLRSVYYYRPPSLSRNQGEWRNHFEFCEV